MDAWEQLTQGSTIPTGDAWAHLMAQGGGGTFEPTTLYVDSFSLEVEGMDEYVVEFEEVNYELNFDSPDFNLEIGTEEYELEIDNA